MASFNKVPYVIPGIPSKCERTESDRNGTKAVSYYVEFTTPQGMVGHSCEAALYDQAKALEGNGLVQLTINPVMEQMRGEYLKKGFYHRLMVLRVDPAPSDKLSDRPLSRPAV